MILGRLFARKPRVPHAAPHSDLFPWPCPLCAAKGGELHRADCPVLTWDLHASWRKQMYSHLSRKYAVRIAQIWDAPHKWANDIKWLRDDGNGARMVGDEFAASRYTTLESARKAARRVGFDPYVSVDVCDTETGRLFDRIDI